jgi:hypothetical protein
MSWGFVVDSIQPTSNARGSAHDAGQYMNGIAHISDSLVSDYEERKLSSYASSLPSVNNSAPQAFEATGFSSDVRSSSNHVPQFSATTETNSRRFRPSFLDSLNVHRASSGTPFQQTEPEKDSYMSNSSNTYNMDLFGSSAFKKASVESESVGTFSKLKTTNGPSVFDQSMNSSVYSGSGEDLVRLSINEHSMDTKQDFYSAKQNEDFAALEQVPIFYVYAFSALHWSFNFAYSNII